LKGLSIIRLCRRRTSGGGPRRLSRGGCGVQDCEGCASVHLPRERIGPGVHAFGPGGQRNPVELLRIGRSMKAAVRRHVGVPVCVGIALTTGIYEYSSVT
jgi:hypothetical protein